MGFVIDGPRTWSGSRSGDGHRDYKLVTRVRSTATPVGRDGPALASLTPGLFLPGSPWLVDNDVDLWAMCRPEMQITPVLVGEPNEFFDIEQNFSTRPLDNDRDPTFNGGRGIEDPLLEQARVSGTFTKGKVEATHNFNGVPILTSSFEQIRGPQVEFDNSTPTIKIEQNVAVLNLPLLCSMVDTVNVLPIWGVNARCVKLSQVSWERKFSSIGNRYYVRTLEFDINFNTHDRALLDEGRKCLNGHWHEPSGNWVLDNIAGAEPDPTNPNHFSQFKDRRGENCRVILNGAGLPSSVMVGLPVDPTVYVVGDLVTYLGNYYVAVRSNINVNPATSDAEPDIADRKWIKLADPNELNDPMPDFDPSQAYPKGSLVTPDSGASIYVSTEAVDSGSFLLSNSWAPLGSEINDRGAWVGGVQASSSGGAGYVYVTYYRGTNFLLLNIPLTF